MIVYDIFWVLVQVQNRKKTIYQLIQSIYYPLIKFSLEQISLKEWFLKVDVPERFIFGLWTSIRDMSISKRLTYFSMELKCIWWKNLIWFRRLVLYWKMKTCFNFIKWAIGNLLIINWKKFENEQFGCYSVTITLIKSRNSPKHQFNSQTIIPKADPFNSLPSNL